VVVALCMHLKVAVGASQQRACVSWLSAPVQHQKVMLAAAVSMGMLAPPAL